MNKAWIWIIGSFLVCLNLSAAGKYTIFKVSGTVRIKSESGWQAAVRRSEVQLRDILSLATNSRVGILEESSGRIYFCAHEGEHSVARIISTARKESDRTIANVNRRMVATLNEQQQQGHTYHIIGATHRGQESDTGTQSVYAALRKALQGKRPSPILQLTWQCDEEVSTPVFQNPTNRPLYMNLIRIEQGEASIALRIGREEGVSALVIPAGCSVVAEGYAFASTLLSRSQWLLFGSPTLFDSLLLQQYLRDQVGSGSGITPAELHTN